MMFYFCLIFLSCNVFSCFHFPLFFISFCARWSSRPWTRRATPTCHGLSSRVRRPREESTPSTRPLFSNIHPPCLHSCVCVPFRGGPVPGPCPGVGHKRRTLPSPHRLKITKTKKKEKKTIHPAPLDEPVQCMMMFGAALSLSSFSSLLFLLPLSLAWVPSSCLQGWRMTFEPRAVVHLCLHL